MISANREIKEHGHVLRNGLRRLPLLALGIVILAVGMRLPALMHPLPIDDEETYSLVANEIVAGGQPYVNAVERKPPLLFWTYAAVFKVAGEYNWKALHVFAVLWTLATMAGLYFAGKNLADPLTGLIAALLYAVFQPWGTFRNLALNGELLMNLPLVWAWGIAFRQSRSRVRPELLAAGALLCAGFLLKQPAAIAAVPIGIYLLLPSYAESRGLTRIDSIVQAAMLTAGFFGTLGLVALLLWKQGILGQAYFWTITDQSVPHVFWTKGVIATLAFIGICLPLLIGAAMGQRGDNEMWANKRAEHIAVLGLTIASAVGAAAGARFYPHYYIQLIPPLALLAAVNYGKLWSRKAPPAHWWERPRVTYVWLGLIVVALFITQSRALAAQRPLMETARYLLEHSDPHDRIFVWGQTPAIYLQAQRRPASRFVVTFPLTGYIFGGLTDVNTSKRIIPGAWSELEEDFKRHPPEYIVDVQVPRKNAQYPVRNFPFLAKLLADKYQPVARTAEGVIYRMRSTAGAGAASLRKSGKHHPRPARS
jgi:4-amino-4-deoxy-L-arabinose transferase-like glycosyltransferase